MIFGLLRKLRITLCVLFLVTLFCAGAIYYSQFLVTNAHQELTKQQEQLQSARLRVQRSGEEKALIAQYVEQYRLLQKNGFIGDEQRINWVDALRIANERTDLFGIKYEISVQQNFPNAATLNPGKLILRQSMMKIEFSLLHEMDLLRFLSELKSQNVGLFHLGQCQLRRIDIKTSLRFQPNISAICQLAWITAKPDDQS